MQARSPREAGRAKRSFDGHPSRFGVRYGKFRRMAHTEAGRPLLRARLGGVLRGELEPVVRDVSDHLTYLISSEGLAFQERLGNGLDFHPVRLGIDPFPSV